MLGQVVRPGSCCSGHTHQTLFSMEGLFERAVDFGLKWVEAGEALLCWKRLRGKKEKGDCYHRRLPVWEAYLKVNLFSCLTSFSFSKTNRAPWVMLHKHTRPLNCHTLPELGFSFTEAPQEKSLSSNPCPVFLFTAAGYFSRVEINVSFTVGFQTIRKIKNEKKKHIK